MAAMMPPKTMTTKWNSNNPYHELMFLPLRVTKYSARQLAPHHASCIYHYELSINRQCFGPNEKDKNQSQWLHITTSISNMTEPMELSNPRNPEIARALRILLEGRDDAKDHEEFPQPQSTRTCSTWSAHVSTSLLPLERYAMD